MPPKRKQETANPAVAAISSPKRNLRNRNKRPQATAVPAAVPSSHKRNQRKRKQSQEDAMSAATLTDSSTLLPRQKRAKQPETTIPAPATGSSTLQELMMGLTYDLFHHLIIQKFNLDPRQELYLDNSSIGVNFSSITYEQAAPRVELEPDWQLRDIQTFEIHRSRIPTDLFKTIITDLDTMVLQYGPPHGYKNEETRSRFFSPVFNHLVKQFAFMLRNEPETVTKGQSGTRGRIEYFFKAFSSIAILCIEMKLGIGNEDERLNAIAQCITECEGCDLFNANKNFSLPVHCILSDGFTFEFFKFTRDRSSSRPSFLRGCFPGDPESLQRGLELPNTQTMGSPLPFILQFRCICETIFDIMLNAYISAIKAACDRESKKAGLPRRSLDSWDQALKLANDAVTTLREADHQRATGDLNSADTTVLEGLRLLNKSTGTVSTVYKSKLFMTGWDEDKVRKA